MNTQKLFDLIKESKSGNPDSMSELIENFDLFLKANAKKTGREDGYNELVNFLSILFVGFRWKTLIRIQISRFHSI